MKVAKTCPVCGTVQEGEFISMSHDMALMAAGFANVHIDMLRLSIEGLRGALRRQEEEAELRLSAEAANVLTMLYAWADARNEEPSLDQQEIAYLRRENTALKAEMAELSATPDIELLHHLRDWAGLRRDAPP